MKDTERTRGMGPSAWIMLAAFLAVCALYCLTPVHNGNFFWHLRNGEDILDTGSIRTHDPFTWTFRGETWLQQEWVSEVLFAISWRTLGQTGPVIFKTLLIMAAVLFMVMAATRRGAGIPAIVLSGLLWFALSHGRWIVRPHIVSILMFSLYLYLLARGTGGVLASLAVFIPLQVIWTNAHGGFVMGWFLLGVPVLEGIIRRDGASVLGRSAVLGGAVLSAGLHPNGFGSVGYLTDFLSRPLFRETIREWWSPFHPLYQPGHRISTTAVLLVVLLVATWIVAAGRRKRIGASRMLALGALSAAALLSSRNIDFLALAAVAWVSPLLGRIRPVIPALMLSAAAALPFIVGVPREFGPPREPGLGVDWSIYPRELTSFLEENPELLSARIFNTNEISGYLEYRLGERLPLYMDGRCHLYTERFYAGYLLLAYARPEDAPAVMGILDSGGIDLALFNWPGPGESSAYILSASPAWLPVYWDSITIVYGRKTFLDETGFLSRSFEVVDPLAPQTLLQVLYYQMPDSWRDELVMAASPPMNYQPAMIPATALMLCTDSLFDSPGFVFGSEGMRSSLDSVLSGSDPGIEDPRLRVLQAWVLARAGRYDDAVQAAERSGDLTLRSSLAVLTENGMRSSVQGASCPPPLMVPPAAWAEYMNGEASMGDSAVIGAAAMFVSGMRTGSLDSVRAILDAGTELSPWGYSVSGSIAVLCGLDSMAVALGATALMMNRNPYTLLMLGNIESVSGNGDRAIELFSESLQLSDGFLEARLQRAEQLWRTGALEEALADYRLLKELNYLTPAAEFHLMWGEHFAASPPAAGE